MGYTHYWRYAELPKAHIEQTARDFAQLLESFAELDIPLAGPCGTGAPIIKAGELAFNGLEKCGHVTAELGIAWPAKHAGGVEVFEDNNGNGTQECAESLISGQWFAGAELEKRTCDGDCSHETFRLKVTQKKQPTHASPYGHLLDAYATEEEKLNFDFTKTAYKPYDLAVQCALIIAQHHARVLKIPFYVTSDGHAEQWGEAVLLCRLELGITDFTLGGVPNV